MKPFNFVKGTLSIAAALFIVACSLFFLLPLPGQPTVLMYHFIGSKLDTRSSANFVTEKTFEKQMFLLRKLGYHVITLNEFASLRAGQRRGGFREILVTFDDGNQSVYDKAWPILKRYQIPSTQFLISEHLIDGGYGSMKLDTVKTMVRDSLISIGAHTRTHPHLKEVSDEILKSELAGSRTDLETMLGLPVDCLAYPYGETDARVIKATQEAGYKFAFTTSPKKLNELAESDYTILRVKISEGSANFFVFWIKLSGIYESFKHWRHKTKNH